MQIEQAIHDKGYIPAPTDWQPEYGNYHNLSIAQITDPQHKPWDKRFSTSTRKIVLTHDAHAEDATPEQAIQSSPAPGHHQPAFGKFSTSIARRVSISNRHGGATAGGFNLSKSKVSKRRMCL